MAVLESWLFFNFEQYVYDVMTRDESNLKPSKEIFMIANSSYKQSCSLKRTLKNRTSSKRSGEEFSTVSMETGKKYFQITEVNPTMVHSETRFVKKLLTRIKKGI